MEGANIRKSYHGEVTTDRYGRKIPKHAHGMENLKRQTSSTKLITDATMALFDRIMNPKLLVRCVTLVANHLIPEDEVKKPEQFQQMNLFTDYAALEAKKKRKKRRWMQEAVLSLKKKFGKNAVLKGMNLEAGFFLAYHMSKDSWITVALDGSVPGDKIKTLVDISFNLTDSHAKKKARGMSFMKQNR